jgi:hypothetical protein
MLTVEFYVLVDESGDFGIGRDEDVAKDNYADDIGGGAGPMRMVKVTLNVPEPKTVEMSGDVPEEDYTGGKLVAK